MTINARNIFSLIFFFSIHVFFAQSEDELKENSILEELESGILKEDIYNLKGKEFPSFKLTLLNGRNFDSRSLKGKPTVLNFWFTNCAPCIDEMPLLNEVKAQFDEEVNFVAITFQSQSEIKSFLRNSDFDFQHVVDAKDYIKSLGFFAYPKTILLDKDFKVISVEKKIPKSIGAETIKNQEEFKNRLITKISMLLKE